MRRLLPFAATLTAFAAAGLLPAALQAADAEAQTEGVRLVKTSSPAPSAQRVLLRYKMAEGETVRTEVTHLAKTLTKVDDAEQGSQSRTVSTKCWKVLSVDGEGNMTFEHSVRNVDASQQVGDKDEVRYNSGGSEVPRQFENVHSQVNQVISTVTIRPSGDVVTRSDEEKYGMLAMGDIAIRFPTEAVAVGQQWETTREIQVRRPDKTPARMKIRELFTLEKLSADVAVIDVKNECLTPIREPEVEAQVMQQMNNGKIRFDVAAGRLISKEILWDSTVIGVSGSGSRLEYSARLSEELLD